MVKSALKVLGFALLVAVMLVALVAALGYSTFTNNVNTKGKYRVDSRPCSASIGDYKLSGVREYKYYEREIFGYRVIDTANIEEVTFYDLPNADFKVVGVNHDGTFKDYTHQPGDTGRLPVDEADSYVFFLNGKVGSVTYKSFCK